MPARQVFSFLNHASQSFRCFTFYFAFQIGSHTDFAQTDLELYDPSCLCLLSSQDCKCVPPHQASFILFLETRYHYVAQTGLQLSRSVLRPPECWDCSYVLHTQFIKGAFYISQDFHLMEKIVSSCYQGKNLDKPSSSTCFQLVLNLLILEDIQLSNTLLVSHWLCC